MKRVISTAIVFILLGMYTAYAQEHSHAGKNEVGISTGVFYAVDDKDWGGGIHLHYFRSIGKSNRWAVGGYLEQAWFEDSHVSVGIGAKFEVLERLCLGAFPGVTLARHHHEEEGGTDKARTKGEFSMHWELVYDLIEWKLFHLGPVLDYSWSKNDSHITLGVHIAVGF